MSHLILKKIDGKWRMFNKITKKVVGKPMENKEEAAIETHKQDIKEDRDGAHEEETGKGGDAGNMTYPKIGNGAGGKKSCEHVWYNGRCRKCHISGADADKGKGGGVADMFREAGERAAKKKHKKLSMDEAKEKLKKGGSISYKKSGHGIHNPKFSEMKDKEYKETDIENDGKGAGNVFGYYFKENHLGKK